LRVHLLPFVFTGLSSSAWLEKGVSIFGAGGVRTIRSALRHDAVPIRLSPRTVRRSGGPPPPRQSAMPTDDPAAARANTDGRRTLCLAATELHRRPARSAGLPVLPRSAQTSRRGGASRTDSAADLSGHPAQALSQWWQTPGRRGRGDDSSSRLPSQRMARQAARKVALVPWHPPQPPLPPPPISVQRGRCGGGADASRRSFKFSPAPQSQTVVRRRSDPPLRPVALNCHCKKVELRRH
jgi:hypothetical protein